MDWSKVLVVSHSQSELDELSKALQSKGYQVSTARDLSESIRNFTMQKPDAVVIGSTMDLSTRSHIKDRIQSDAPNIPVIDGDPRTLELQLRQHLK
ncbi:hypothetical protein [Pontibacter sp. G13]|uniref:hypothetical protein n=1 Tax=Pontibacter sp. G13 TaxID=3074898 RepID=UPI00288AFCD8|nr:hypothetical protein [Pontibacter sp. G13]WNJ17486.1 hypothetical protein RJD25_21775 [Pontibacter sp. G13]